MSNFQLIALSINYTDQYLMYILIIYFQQKNNVVLIKQQSTSLLY